MIETTIPVRVLIITLHKICPDRVTQAIPPNLSEIFILADGMIVIPRLPQGACLSHHLIHCSGRIAFKTLQDLWQRQFLKLNTAMHMIRHHNGCIQNKRLIPIKPF